MNSLRFEALNGLFNNNSKKTSFVYDTEAEFAQNVFNDLALQKSLNQDAYQEISKAIFKGTKISRVLADQIAAAMKSWARSKGATHYTHWFQPLTGATAEKHQSFFDLSDASQAIEQFDGSQLVQQEPDASSFPSGGIRNTFEARGYTAWDPTSPAFIYGKTLCIPTIFVSYTGEALDYKTPLIRSLTQLGKAATEVARYFDKNTQKVYATLGWEQEYFLIDKTLAASRPDLILTGRTLMGHESAKGQQLNDHYFGSIPARALSFMQELEYQSLLLGIPVKTRHNEVAPAQFELAPIFEEANLSVDHNALLLDVMNKIADKHDFMVLLHEKPFSGINGSGKHNNWSLRTNSGTNLLSPGKTPMNNLQFLTFFINTIVAVLNHESLLRGSIVSASNELRLGSDEAPMPIMSVFIGEQLTDVLNNLEQVSEGKLSPKEKTDLKLNVIGKIPEILLDNTDQNRTSPFAFTGNKFEFRAVGSKTNCAKPITVLNSTVAEQLSIFKAKVDGRLENPKMKKDDAIFNELRDSIKHIRTILFEGDGYSETWIKNAKKRGLNPATSTPDAIKAYLAPKSITLFKGLKVFSERELESRVEVDLQQYTYTLQIEGRVLGDIARNHIIPTAIKYQNTLIDNVKGLKEIYGKDFESHAKEQMLILERISGHIAQINLGVGDMISERKKANLLDDSYEKASAYHKLVKPYFESIRYHCDKLELLVDNSIWPLAKYRELLFSR
ncbi:MAG: glutamine synthetase III [Flavobacteriaceae bacterium]|nr:glutamine synthetase III [Flavobacteriaceae bacterium]